MDIISVAIAVVVFLAMVVAGLDVTSHDLLQVARRPGLLIGATAAQFVLLPLLGVALVRGLSLEPGLRIAIALLAAPRLATDLVTAIREALAGHTFISPSLSLNN